MNFYCLCNENKMEMKGKSRVRISIYFFLLMRNFSDGVGQTESLRKYKALTRGGVKRRSRCFTGVKDFKQIIPQAPAKTLK